MEGNNRPNNTSTADTSDTLTATVTIILTATGCVEFAASVTINVLLCLTICCSSTLKTPPNFLLINICINNILSSLGAMLEFVILLISGQTSGTWSLVLAHTLVIFSYLVYWNLFAAVANYRLRTLRNPAMSPGERKTIICASLVAVWIVSTIFAASSALYVATRPSHFYDNNNNNNNNTFNNNNNIGRNFNDTSLTSFEPNKSAPIGKIIITTLCILDIMSCLAVLIYSFWSIFKVLFSKQALRRNRIVPVLTAGKNCNNLMTSSTCAKLSGPLGRNYLSNDSVFTSSKDLHSDSRDPMPRSSSRQPRMSSNTSSSWAEPEHAGVFSLKTSASASDFLPQIGLKLESLQPTSPTHLGRSFELSTASRSKASIKLSPFSRFNKTSKESCDFTDITVGAELYRLQFANQRLALRHQLFHRHQLSGLGRTIRNNVTMIGLFVVTSLSLVVALFCRVFAVDTTSFVLFFYISLLILNLNGTLYPIWYFIVTKKVRRSFHSILLSVHRKIA
jgi:hypothetical protein